MPEGDILRRVARRLTPALVGKPITYCLLRWPTLGGVSLTGQTVQKVAAYGKHVFMDLDSGFTFRSHLRMDGAWIIERAVAGRPDPRSFRPKSWQARAVLANAEWVAIGWRLGMADLLRTRDVERLTGPLGPDVMADGFDAAAAAERVLAEGRRPIGATLLDQSVVAGIGTIYMAESLHAWGVRPDRPAEQVPDVAGLLRHAAFLLRRSVEARTPTATGQTLAGQTSLVHGREKRPCRKCGTAIAVMRVGLAPYDRPAFYCPACQPG
jgi:endonuclease-8